MGSTESWLSHWQSLRDAAWPQPPSGAPGDGADPSSGPAGLHESSSAFARFAAEFARVGASFGPAANPSDRARLESELEALAQRFFAGAVPPWPALPGQGADWAVALQAWSMVLAEIARASAAAFVARLAGPDGPRTLRATFDVWIDCAESAFQSAAHSEAFAQAQGRLLNEFVRLRIRQQALLEQAARLAGLPTRREVDLLHDSVQELKAELARRPAPSVAKPVARTPKAITPRKRPRR